VDVTDSLLLARFLSKDVVKTDAVAALVMVPKALEASIAVTSKETLPFSGTENVDVIDP